MDPRGVEDNIRGERHIEAAHETSHEGRILFIDIIAFISLLNRCFETSGATRKKDAIEKLLASTDWIVLHIDKKTGCHIYCEKEKMDHPHEIQTAKALCQMNYDMLFAPLGMFQREEKKSDVFLIRNHVILKADFKGITSKNPDTIAKSIKSGSEQASRLVLDIFSDIEKKVLIDGLKSGVAKNRLIKEILLFYNKRFYQLSRDLILSKKIYKTIK